MAQHPSGGGARKRHIGAREAVPTHDVHGEASSDSDTAMGEDDTAQDSSRFAPGRTTYAVQCNVCFKLRIMPSKEMYETVGERILEKPFVCVDAQAWRDDASCDDPADVEDNEPRVLFAIEKHSVPRAPDGFYRKVVPRAKNEIVFGDTYYKTPCGKTLRSLVQVEKYLAQHPEINAKREQFSFSIPKSSKGSFEEVVKACLKRFLRTNTQPSAKNPKSMKGKPKLKTAGHGQPSRPQPLVSKGPLAKSTDLSALEPNAVCPDKLELKQLHGLKGDHHPTGEKFAAENLGNASGEQD